MLAVSPLRDTRDEKQGEMEGFDRGALSGRDDIMDDESFDHFSTDGNLLLESIDFDDLFVGINDGDVLPDLEMDPVILADFSVVSPGLSGEESVSNGQVEDYNNYYCPISKDEDELDKISGSGSGSGSGSRSGLDSSLSTRGEEIVSKRVEEVNIPAVSRSKLDGGKGRKSSHSSSAEAKHKQGKRKVKVDWTPELHRRFVQAVEQLGVDKAVPSRILELMGIDCLTRHNIASHLQKYRSHRKHLLAREAEAASWSQRRQMYGGGTVAAAVVGGGASGGKRSDVLMSQWHAPTMGFPPVPPPMHHFRPLHVWGHPSMDNSVMHMWPKHLLPHPPSATPPPPTPWLAPLPPPVPPPDSSYWHHHHHNQRVRNGAACFPQAGVAQARFRTTTAISTPPVPGIPSPPPPPPQPMYKVDPSAAAAAAVVATTGQPAGSHPLFDLQPSKESIDAAIGDVMSKPWLPLPLGLKPPSTDGVLVELQRQGIPKIPPPHVALDEHKLKQKNLKSDDFSCTNLESLLFFFC